LTKLKIYYIVKIIGSGSLEIKNYKRIRNNIYEIELDNFKKYKREHFPMIV